MRISNAEKTIRIRKLKSERGWILASGIARLGIGCIIVWVFLAMNYGVYVVSGNDMYPAIRDGDVAIVYRHPDYINGDAVILKNEDKYIASRIEAVRGSEISETRDGHLTIDGNLQPVQERSGIFSETVNTGDSIEYPYQVGEGSVLLLGDNREVAKDSRLFGPIKEEALLGKTFMIIRRRAI